MALVARGSVVAVAVAVAKVATAEVTEVAAVAAGAVAVAMADSEGGQHNSRRVAAAEGGSAGAEA